jgi:hypothetical protein
MYHHAILITLYAFHKTPNHENITPTQAQSICLSSARSIGQCMQIYRASWGLDPMPMFIIQWIKAALLTLLEHLDDPENREAFIILCIAAKAFSRRFEKTKPLLRSLQDTAREMKISLPVEADPLFAELEGQRLPRLVGIKDETSDQASSDV